MKGKFALYTAALLLVGVLIFVVPAGAIKVYVNPSIQTANVSPDGSYQEASAMQDVAGRTYNKLIARGFEARNGGWLDPWAAADDAYAWGANCFVALHTNAMGGGWQTGARGTETFYHLDGNGWYLAGARDIASCSLDKCVSKFGAFGRGYRRQLIGNDLGITAYWKLQYIDTTLVEGLFHDNWDDVQLIKSTAGKDAYAQAVFEAVCDHYGWGYSSTNYFQPWGGPTIPNNDGRLEFFAHGSNNNIYHCWQTAANGSFSAWTSLGANAPGKPVCGRNLDGRIEVYARGFDGNIWTKVQTGANNDTSWTSWINYGGPMASDVTVGMNMNGCLEMFARGNDNALWHKWQTAPNSGWSGWSSMGGGIAGNPACGRSSDGRLWVFARGGDNILYFQCHLYPGGNWSGWISTGISIGGDPVVSNDQDGRIELVARGTGGDIIDSWQAVGNVAKFNGESVGGSWTGNPALMVNKDGRLEAFARDEGSWSIYHKWQTAPNSAWGAWSSFGGYLGGDPMVARQADGCLWCFCRGTNGVMYYIKQLSAGGGWGGWTSMGSALF